MNPEDTDGWNPDQACEEMAALFKRADQIMSKPHYQQVEASTKSLSGSGADSLPTTELTNRKD